MDWRSINNEKEKYAAYLCSREWAEKREAVRERAGNKCERCGVLPMDACHHRSYERKYEESLDDLQAICNPCHEYTHGKSEFDPACNGRFINWLMIAEFAEAKWLYHQWKVTFLAMATSDPRLLVVFQVWLSCRFAWTAANDMLVAYADHANSDGDTVRTCGAMPIHAELAYQRTLSRDEYAFWSWLCWDGPTQYPIGDKEAFDKCIELAKQLRCKT